MKSTKVIFSQKAGVKIFVLKVSGTQRNIIKNHFNKDRQLSFGINEIKPRIED